MYALTDYQVVREVIEKDGIQVHVVPLTTPKHCCYETSAVKNGTRFVKVRDVPLGSHPLRGIIKQQRYHCKACGKVQYQAIPGIAENHNMTQRLVTWIEQEAAKRPFLEVANRCAMDEKIVRVIFKEYVDTALAEKNVVTPELLGLDEVRIGKATRAVVTNLGARTVFDVLADRGAATIEDFLERLPNKDAVKRVAMDIWPTYRNAVRKHLPDAQVVVDRWHVEAGCVSALEIVRKQVRESTPKARHGTLAKDRVSLLKNEADLNSEERESLESIFLNHPILKQAHTVKERFKEVYTSSSPEEAEARYAEWRRSIPPGVEKAFRSFSRQCDEWQSEIFAFVGNELTNAFTEYAVKQIRILLTQGSGYSFDVLRAKILLTSRFRRQEREFKNAGMAPSTIMSFGAGGNSKVVDLGVDVDRLKRFSDEIERSGDIRRFGLIDEVAPVQALPVNIKISLS